MLFSLSWLAMMLVARATGPGADAKILADTGDPCAPAEVVATVPTNGATGVPVDVRPAAVISGCGASSYALQLFEMKASFEDFVAGETFEWDAARTTGVLELYPPGDLLPQTTYLFRITATEGFGEITEVSFTTGQARIVGFEGRPGVVIDYVWIVGPDAPVELDANGRISPVHDPDGLSLVHLVDVDDAAVIHWSGPALDTSDVPWDRSWTEASMPETVCYRAVQVDGAGRASAPSDPACRMPDEKLVGAGSCGCSAAGGPGWALGSLVAILLARRRRRARVVIL